MRTFLSIMILISLILGSLLLSSVRAAPPLIKRPMELYEATIQGASIVSVDPAQAYDTESGELIQNVYDTLLVLDGEHVDRFLPSVAVTWTSFPINETGPEGQQWNYRYVFQTRTGILFQPPYNYSLTTDDVEYSFEREMVQDTSWGPAWMLYEPLLNNAAGAAGLGNLSDPVNVQYIGRLIDHAVESNATHVWFNLMFRGAYAPFLKILCQTWGSILSRQWIVNQVIGEAGRPDWTGDWSMSHIGWGLDHTEWIDHYDPLTSPLDSFPRMMYGSGPFILQTLDESNQFWLLSRNVAYWRGWPADYPANGASPAGYVDTVRCTWAYTWTDSLSMFLNGDVDLIAVPRKHIGELYQSATQPYDPPNYPKDGVRCFDSLPEPLVDALFFEFAIDPATSYTVVGPAGQFSENLIPVDFFGNTTWGLHVRKAFSYAIDYNAYLQQAFLGEAQHPATAIVPGLPYFDPAVQGYTYNRTREIQEFQAVPGLWDTGFNITLPYTATSSITPDMILVSLLKSEIEAVNPKFHVSLYNLFHWYTYDSAAAARQLPLFYLGWLADYSDPADFAYPFYRTGDYFANWSAYSDPAMDALVDQGMATPDGPARQTIYSQIQQLAVDDCPSTTTDQALGRHFERDWVVGWYYNPSYPGNFFYNLWKWYYIPESRLDSPTQPAGFNLPADVNYDGKVDMKDIGVIAKAFGSNYGPPIHPRWVYRADVNNDRKIDMKDIGYVAKQFGKTSPKWTPT